MINEYIENGQYNEALELLEDLSNEQNRYLRLVCLFALGEYTQAYKEVVPAKNSSKDTYYDVVAMEVSILKELDKYEEAIDILITELSMPYIPYQFEMTFQNAYDEILLLKQDSKEIGQYQGQSFSMEDIASILQREVTNEDVLYMAIEQLQDMNIRRLVYDISLFLKDPRKPNFAKTLLIELMIDQAIDEELEVCKNGNVYYINPSFAPMVMQQFASETIEGLLSNHIEYENPSLYQLCMQYASFYLYTVYPREIYDEDCNAIAGAIHYHIATMQFIEIDKEDILVQYNCEENEFVEILKSFDKIEFQAL